MLTGEISAGNAKILADLIWKGRWESVELWLKDAAGSARSKQCETVLLSSEWLLGALANDVSMERLSDCLRRVDADSVNFLLLLRDPVEQLISHYKHRAKRGTIGSIDAWAEHSYDLPRRLAGFRHQMEAGNVKLVVRGYGKKPGSLEQLFFSDWLGVPVPEAAANLQVNPSLSLSELVLLRQLNAHHPGMVPYLYDRLLAIPLDQKREGQEMLEHSRRVAVQSVARYTDEWTRWNDLVPSGERFDIPEPGPQPGTEPTALELSAEQLSVVMQLLSDVLGYRLRLQVLWSWRLRPVLARIKRVVLPGSSRR